ncbi:toll/interleukin-1 receptor domain-containing protein [Enterococcus gilvus]|uniref:toll/interleukin-1 receptor domain-containing protein n=1 Tax=Enterococcus gilvus TaxID=160453 RepID=UPI003EDA6F58
MNKQVFISYAWEENVDSDKKVKEFAQWLAIHLKKWGFNVLLDVFNNFPGSKLDEYMKNGINDSHFVICICTETYSNKMNNPSTGVHNEINLLKEKANSPFIIPVIEKGIFRNLPSFFSGKYVSELKFDPPSSQENQKSIFELVSTLRDELLPSNPIDIEARVESYYNNVEKLKFFNKSVNLMHFIPQTKNRITFRYLLNGKDFKLGIKPMDFITHWSTAGSDGIYSYRKVAEMMRIHDFQSFDDINKPADIKEDWLVPIDWSVCLKQGDGIIWINKDNYLAIGKIIDIYLDSEDEYKSTVTLEYKILNPIDLTTDFIEESSLKE